MNHLVNNVIKPLVLVAAAALLSATHQGCYRDGVQPGLNDAYMAETLKCVSEAKTQQDSRMCRAAVNWKYGLCPDPIGETLCQ